MALSIVLVPIAPGQALLQVAGVMAIPERIALAVQRNDGHWLGLGRQWQDTPHWHPMFTAEAAADGIQLLLGEDLVDSFIAVGGSPLQVTLRLDEVTDAGVLRIRGSLVGAGAAAEPTPLHGADDTLILGRGPRPDPATDPTEDTLANQQEGEAAPDQPPSTPQPATRRRLWPWVALGAVLVLTAAGIGAWKLGPWGVAPEDASSPDAEVPDTTPASIEPTLDPTGVELARTVIDAHIEADAVFARAEAAEQDGDCAAAFALYSEAANRDPGLAARLARRYDPLTHTPGPCIAQPDAPYAIVYYQDAAEAGDTTAQRRIGRLMAEREPSGPTHQAGLDWLRRAAQAGDTEAAGDLEQLGER